MKQRTIGQRILLGFGALTLIACALAATSFLQLHSISQSSALITNECLPAIGLVERIDFFATEDETLLLKHILTKNEDLQSEFASKIRSNVAAMTALVESYGHTFPRGGDPSTFERFSAA